MEKETIKIKHYHSPVGEWVLGSCGGGLCLCDWVLSRRRAANDRRLCRRLHAVCEEGGSSVIAQAVTQLDEYFGGRRKAFSVPVVFAGTEFQCCVWEGLMQIPYGATVSYAELARRIGHPRAVRAVASAVAGNPLSIVVPCHRVVGSDRKLTGYAGGLEAKQWLLALEQGTLPASSMKIREMF